ncbi:MAG: PLP-dependent aminotransferase family protein, partial [Rhizobiaceae bacterium]
VKFAYLSGDFANPTGETVSREARERVLDLAEALDIPVIEDAAYQSLRYEGEEIPPILALDIARHGGIENTRTLYCGSFSKTLAPGLRVGWVCGATPVISKLVLTKQAADLHSSTLNQMAIHKVAVADFAGQVGRIKAAYQSRRDAMLKALDTEMPAGVSWTHPDGGMFVWITLPETFDGAELLAECLKREKVAFVPGKAFFADGSGGNTIRLSFSRMAEPEIAEGIARLGRVLRAAA